MLNPYIFLYFIVRVVIRKPSLCASDVEGRSEGALEPRQRLYHTIVSVHSDSSEYTGVLLRQVSECSGR